MTEGTLDTRPRRRIPWLALLPVLVFVALAGLFAVRLYGGDPSKIPSVLIGRPVPAFTLPPVEGLQAQGFSAADLKAGHVSVVNVFASWCVPCRDEHPLLMTMSRDPEMKSAGVQIYGLNYKDAPQNARDFITQMGDPYDRIGADRPGRAAIDWGVYGVPETFIVRGDGTIAYKQIGPITREALDTKILPEIRAAMKPAQKAAR